MRVADDLHTRFPQLLRVTPMRLIRHGIPHHGKILVAVHTYHRFPVWFPVQPEAIFPFELDAADSDAPSITIDRIPRFILHINHEII